MYVLNKLTRLLSPAMMIRDYKLLVALHHIHMVPMLERYVKQLLYENGNKNKTEQNPKWSYIADDP